MAARLKIVDLFFEPRRLTFRNDQADLLDRRLRELVDATVHIAVDDPADLRMSLDGLVSGKYRYTPDTFTTICHTLSPGLAELIKTIAGMRRSDNDDPDLHSKREAIRIFNTVLDRRFAKVAGSRLVVSEADECIEAIVGPVTTIVENTYFFDLVRNAIEDHACIPIRFIEGGLYGRRLVLRYLSDHLLGSLDSPDGIDDRYCLGYHFANVEGASKSSVQAAVAIYRDRTNESAVALNYGRHRLVRVGRDVEQRMAAVVASVVERDGSDMAVQDWLQRLTRRRLPLDVVRNADKERRRREIAVWLRAKGTSWSIAHKAAGQLFLRGAYDLSESELPILPTRSELASRTAYDLFCCLLRLGRRVAPGIRESVEGTAFRLLQHGIQISGD